MSMRIIISPAKKMNQDTDSLAWTDLPAFLDQTSQLLSALRTMSCAELKTLWRCNDQIAELNFERFRHMNLERNLTPAFSCCIIIFNCSSRNIACIICCNVSCFGWFYYL